MNFKITAIILLFSVLVLDSCTKVENIPARPKIEYTSFTVFDTTDILGNTLKGGRLKFSFEDGDGDLGLPVPSEGQNFDSINLFLVLYRVNNGDIALAPDDDPLKPTGFRIPFMTRTGLNRVLRGSISVVFQYFFCTEEDSIKYDFFIKDRADNISNVESTSTLPIFFNGEYTE